MSTPLLIVSLHKNYNFNTSLHDWIIVFHQSHYKYTIRLTGCQAVLKAKRWEKFQKALDFWKRPLRGWEAVSVSANR
jgi:hypothetical protein